MPSNSNEGSQTATVTTTHTLATVTTPGNYYLKVDVSNLALGDTLELIIEDKPRSTGTTRKLFHGVYVHAQDDLIVESSPISTVNETVYKLLQSAGTSRAFDWSVVDMS